MEAYRYELRLVEREVEPELALPEHLHRAADAAAFVDRLLREEPGEVGGAIFTGREARVHGFATPFRGTRTQALIEIRHLLRLAIGCEAEGLILFHNHPWGIAAPSQPDYELTRSVAAGCEVVRLTLVDHVIVGRGGAWYSMRERGDLRSAIAGELVEWRRAAAAAGREAKPDGRRNVKPKYRDPKTGQTWAGRGSAPAWLRAHLAAGRTKEEFRIRRES